MLVNMADELQNISQFFRRFTIPPDPLDAQIPRPGPHLFHSILVTIYNELFEPKLQPWIDLHGLTLTAMYVVLAPG